MAAETDRKGYRRGKWSGEETSISPSRLNYWVARRKPSATVARNGPEGEEMKKQTLKAVTMLVSIIALAFATAVVSNAQSRTQQLNADIPFDFVVGNKTLAAGQYSVRPISSDGGTLVRSRDGRHSAIRLTNGVIADAPKKQASLTFRRYGNTYFLAQVWMVGSTEGREMIKSKAERAVERELARNSSSNSLAQNAKPEIVTIIAEVE
jgi:hypothetical protein